MTEGENIILGIWDGHDSGAALCMGGEIISAVNEERLTRRKLEIAFPHNSITECLRIAGLSSQQVSNVAYSTTDFSKTLTRVFPTLKENYYQLRRRKQPPGLGYSLKKMAKYEITTWSPSALSCWISRRIIRNQLLKSHIIAKNLIGVDHHQAHAASAVFGSGYSECLVATIDGIGDGKSGSLWTWRDQQLTPVGYIGGRDSLGIFFEHVTNLLNMRELEDEGKVMALANFASPIKDEENPLFSFFTLEGINLRCRYSPLILYKELKKVLWHYPAEQFAYLAQRVLESFVPRLLSNALRLTGMSRIAYAGGVASNVKVNMLIRELSEAKEMYVFPHMGDGGLAIGAAYWASFLQTKKAPKKLSTIFLGSSFSEEETAQALKKYPHYKAQKLEKIECAVADLIAKGEVVFWVQNRMEIGPRALGARSILSRPDSISVKDDLNIKLKKRVWFQPFCPVLLEGDAREMLQGYDGRPESYMTSAYRVAPNAVNSLCGVINVDGTCRPQILPDSDDGLFALLVREIKKRIGIGALLNTSFNLHGEPLVCSPEDALRTFARTEVRYLAIGNYIICKP